VTTITRGELVHPQRLRQLVATVPDTVDAEQRAQLLAHVRAADDCRLRIERVRGDLRRALDGRDAGAGERALDLACELDGLERVQHRIDGWLTGLVEELGHTPTRHGHYGGGVPA
jgi:hypothetical protein